MDVVDPDGLPIGVLRLDVADRVVSANAAFLSWWGDQPIVGRAFDDVLIPAADFLETVGSGSTMMIHANRRTSAALVTRAATAEGSIVTLLDASDRYAAGLELRRSHGLADRTRTRLQLVIDASIAFAAATTEERLAEILASTTAQAYRAEESVVLLRDAGGLRHAAGANPFAELIEISTVRRAALELRQVLRVSGVEQGDALAAELGALMRRTGVQSVIVAPLLHEGDSFGLFACFFHHPRQFDQEAAPLAVALAGQAAQTLITLRLQHRLQQAAMHDETTGLANRRLLEEQVDALLGAGRISVLFLDLDGFKQVNDTLGHQQGDEVLREVGRRLQLTVREDDLVARYGGDEFVVVCRTAEDATAFEIAERLRRALEEPYSFLPENMRLSASVGVATGLVADGALPIDPLIRAADQAMYRAKDLGGNRVEGDGAEQLTA